MQQRSDENERYRGLLQGLGVLHAARLQACNPVRAILLSFFNVSCCTLICLSIASAMISFLSQFRYVVRAWMFSSPVLLAGWLAGWLDGWMVQVLHIQLLQGLYHRPSCCSAPGRPPDGPRVICRRVRSQDIALSHRSPCHLCNQWQKLKVFCCADTCTGAAADCRWVSQADWSRCRDHSDLPSAASKRHGKGRKQRCVTLFMRW